MLEFLNGDRHPDACAARLHLSLATLASTTMLCPWSLAREARDYAARRHAVDAACRLALADEARRSVAA